MQKMESLTRSTSTLDDAEQALKDRTWQRVGIMDVNAMKSELAKLKDRYLTLQRIFGVGGGCGRFTFIFFSI